MAETGAVTSRGRLTVVLLSLTAAAAASASMAARAEPAAPLDVSALLDAYAAGDVTGALRPLERATVDQIDDFRLQLTTTTVAAAWIARVPGDGPRRTLVAAALALEAEAVFAERGRWAQGSGDPPCAGRCVVEWACSQLRLRGEPDEAERVWMLASVALAGGVRSWTFLLQPLSAPRQRTRVVGHVLHALERFPDEPRLRLARAMAIASRYAVAREMDAPRAGERTGPANTPAPPGRAGGPPPAILSRRNTAIADLVVQFGGSADYARESLAALATDPIVGADARMRLGYLHLQTGDYDAAVVETRAAAAMASDADLRYVSHYLAGQSAQTLGDLDAAETHYRTALDARPRAQSATLALAALLHARGAGSEAYDLVAASIAARPAAPDPWRAFLYGDYPRLPQWLTELRRLVAS
jgi:tetratricopeptide (TPR) repeat protein